MAKKMHNTDPDFDTEAPEDARLSSTQEEDLKAAMSHLLDVINLEGLLVIGFGKRHLMATGYSTKHPHIIGRLCATAEAIGDDIDSGRYADYLMNPQEDDDDQEETTTH